jgi:hypothetical protein
MSVAEILEQAKALSVEERKELLKQIIDTFDGAESVHQSKTGAEIVAMLHEMEPIEFVDPGIEDPVEWVKAQRRKRADKLKAYRDGTIE